MKDENNRLGERFVVVSSENMTMMSKVEEAKERNMMLEKQVLELEQRVSVTPSLEFHKRPVFISSSLPNNLLF